MSVVRTGMALLAVVVVGCGGGGTDPGGNPNPNPNPNPTPIQCTSTSASIEVGNNNFTPRCTTVPTGTTVTWTWASGGVEHNVTFQSGTNSANQGSGTFQRAFPNAGTFPYTCTIHGQSMSGEVRVQ